MYSWSRRSKHSSFRHTALSLSVLLLASSTVLPIGFGQTTAVALEAEDLVSYVDPLTGSMRSATGSTVPGPSLPNGSIWPSPDTLSPYNGGYNYSANIVGFSQLHVQGSGGTMTYGNFLVSPQTGVMSTLESDHASGKSGEVAQANYYKVGLTKYNVTAEVTPSQHAALYRFTYPAGTDSSILLDVGRKLNGQGLKSGSVTINPSTRRITGGGIYRNNWNPAEYNLYFAAEVSKSPGKYGTWDQNGTYEGQATRTAGANKLGAYLKFNTTAGEVVSMKIAVSFKSVAQAESWLTQEIPAWDFDGLKSSAATAWNGQLNKIAVEGLTSEQKVKFYTALYHSMTHPRNRTGDNGNWTSTQPFFDDHYTIWDTWKTAFPLMSIIRPDLVRDNINSFLDRQAHNGRVTDAFIMGKDYNVGQGGNDIDNVITDAYVKGIQGVDWEQAYTNILKFDADRMRTPNYRNNGYVAVSEPLAAPYDYSYRMASGSGTLAFAYNDYNVAQLAKGLGKTADYNLYNGRAKNWLNVWDSSAASDGFTGFIRGRNLDGTFQANNLKLNTTDKNFYEGSSWIYSNVVPHDVAGLVAKMGGRDAFVNRLQYALSNNLIDFTNEPSFQTIWLFANENVNRPDLASYWARELLRKFGDRAYPGDEDNGAMSSLYTFLTSGFFPVAGQDVYYLHGPSNPKTVFQVGSGKSFTVIGNNASDVNKYVQSATLNGQPLNQSWIRHSDITNGGTLVFEMGPQPSTWASNAAAGTVNIAVGRTATESGYATTSEMGAKIVDGNTATKWSSRDTQADNGAHWVKLDLGNSYQISRWVVTHAGSESPGYITRDFRLQRSNDGVTWTDVDTVTGNTINVTSRTVSPFTARYVRLYITNPVQPGTTNVSARIYELELYSTSGIMGSGNIARDKTATENAYATTAEMGAKTVDGSTATKWSCRSTQSDNGAYWVRLDLGSKYQVSRWKVTHAGSESATYITRDFKLQKSDDGVNWVTVDSVTGNTVNVTDRQVAPFAAKYIRLHITNPVQAGAASVSARIYELELYS